MVCSIDNSAKYIYDEGLINVEHLYDLYNSTKDNDEINSSNILRMILFVSSVTFESALKKIVKVKLDRLLYLGGSTNQKYQNYINSNKSLTEKETREKIVQRFTDKPIFAMNDINDILGYFDIAKYNVIKDEKILNDAINARNSVVHTMDIEVDSSMVVTYRKRTLEETKQMQEELFDDLEKIINYVCAKELILGEE